MSMSPGRAKSQVNFADRLGYDTVDLPTHDKHARAHMRAHHATHLGVDTVLGRALHSFKVQNRPDKHYMVTTHESRERYRVDAWERLSSN
eukprot:240341-Chlamydomonas_euryale.AAC.19